MNYIEDMIYVNKIVLNQTLKGFTKNWKIIFTAIVYTGINIIAYNVLGMLFVGPLSILAGIAFTLLASSIVSNYLYLLFNIISYDRITIENFKEGFTYYIRKIYGVFFIAYIASLLLGFVMPVLGSVGAYTNMLISMLILVALNALPETIYLKWYDAWESILYALEFIKENWLNWLIPNIIFYGAIFFVSGDLLLNIFNTHLSFGFFMRPRSIIIYILVQIMFSFMMIYRGHLYKMLSTSTRRKRMFMKKI